MNLEFDIYYEKLLSYLNFDYIEFFINNDEEFSKLFQYQVFLINKSNLEYKKIDDLNNKFKKLDEHKFKFDFQQSFENNEELFLEIKKTNKQINKMFFDKCLTNNKNIDQTKIETINNTPVQEKETINSDELNIENIKNDDELTEEEKRLKKIKKYTIAEKFKYLCSFRPWYKNIRRRHIPIFIIIRKKPTADAMKEKLLKEFISLYNKEFEVNFTINNLSKEFKRIYEKNIVNWGYKQAIRIWILIVGIPLMAVTISLVFIFAWDKGNDNSSSTKSLVLSNFIENIKNLISK